MSRWRPKWMATRKSQHEGYDRFVREPRIVEFYHSTTWTTLRNRVIAEQPLCPWCLDENKLIEAREVHHICPVKTHWHLRLDRTNLVGLCVEHHRKAERDAT